MHGSSKHKESTSNTATLLFFLKASVFLDSLCNIVAVPMIAAYASIIPFTLTTLTINQVLTSVVQIGSTLVAEKLALRHSAFLALAVSTAASAVSMHFVTFALKGGSNGWFTASRAICGLLRHNKLLADLSGRELDFVCSRKPLNGASEKGAVYGKQAFYWLLVGLPVGIVLGGTASEHLGVEGATSIYASAEAVNCAMLLVLFYLNGFPSRPRNVPAVRAADMIIKPQETTQSYSRWAVQRFRSVQTPAGMQCLQQWLTLAVVVFGIACTQCQFPFILFGKYNVFGTGMGLAMCACVAPQIFIAPHVVSFVQSKAKERNIPTRIVMLAALALLCCGTAILQFYEGPALWLYMSLYYFTIEVPAWVALALLKEQATSAPFLRTSPAAFVGRAVAHAEAATKAWTPIVFLSVGAIFPSKTTHGILAFSAVAVGTVITASQTSVLSSTLVLLLSSSVLILVLTNSAVSLPTSAE